MLDLLYAQQFYLKVDLIQTAFTCQDSLIFYHVVEDVSLVLPTTNCKTSYNGSIVSLTVALPAQTIIVQLILPGLRTVGAIRVGLTGQAASNPNGRLRNCYLILRIRKMEIFCFFL